MKSFNSINKINSVKGAQTLQDPQKETSAYTDAPFLAKSNNNNESHAIGTKSSSSINLARINTTIVSTSSPFSSQPSTNTSAPTSSTNAVPPLTSTSSTSTINRRRSNSNSKFLSYHNNQNQKQTKQIPPQASTNNVTKFMKRTEIIGRGKFGVVYKAFHIKTKQVFAIKVLNLDTPEDEVEDVQKEIQFLSGLKQISNITRYYGSYLNDTKLWVVMEYCAGGSLRTLLKPGIIDEKYTGVILRELLVALTYIHADNVIHRDIKSANVLITSEGQVKLCDFGVAAKLTQTRLKRQTMAGTPYWMAPEVILEGASYDTKADIWSLGITAFEISTGNPPYCELDALKVMQLISKSQPPRLEGRQYSALLKEFVALCLDEDPVARLSADDLLKTKFIQQYKTFKVSILKDLLVRYQTYREKHKPSGFDSVHNDDLSSLKENIDKPLKSSSNLVDVPATPLPMHGTGKDLEAYLKNMNQRDDPSKESVQDKNDDIKWDFDSIGSREYILSENLNQGDDFEVQRYDDHYWDNEHVFNDEDKSHFYQPNTISRDFAEFNTSSNIALSRNNTLNRSLSQASNTKNMHSHHINSQFNTESGVQQYSTTGHQKEISTHHNHSTKVQSYITNSHMNINTNLTMNVNSRQLSQNLGNTNNFRSVYNSQAINTTGGGLTRNFTTKKFEESAAKAPKQLLMLFDTEDGSGVDNDLTPTLANGPDTFVNYEPRKSIPEEHLDVSRNIGVTKSSSSFLQQMTKSKRSDLFVGTQHSQSTPALPSLNTNLDYNGTILIPHDGSSTTVLNSGLQSATPHEQNVIEIEIPEELPIAVTPSMASIPTQIKPRSRSSTFSSHTNGPQMAKIQRRPTFSTLMHSGTGITRNTSPVKPDLFVNTTRPKEDIGDSASPLNNVSQQKTFNLTSGENSTVSIDRLAANSGSSFTPSPKRKRNVSIVNGQFTGVGVEHIGANSNITMTASPVKENNEIINSLLQPRNNVFNMVEENGDSRQIPSNQSSGTAVYSMNIHTGNHAENLANGVPSENNLEDVGGKSNRMENDFKKNNPNLKLQMPSPTVANDSLFFQNADLREESLNQTNFNNIGATPGGTINQFGFNTNNTSNIPIAMTPLSEKPVLFGSHSTTVLLNKSTELGNNVIHEDSSISNPNNHEVFEQRDISEKHIKDFDNNKIANQESTLTSISQHPGILKTHSLMTVAASNNKTAGLAEKEDIRFKSTVVDHYKAGVPEDGNLRGNDVNIPVLSTSSSTHSTSEPDAFDQNNMKYGNNTNKPDIGLYSSSSPASASASAPVSDFASKNQHVASFEHDSASSSVLASDSAIQSSFSPGISMSSGTTKKDSFEEPDDNTFFKDINPLSFDDYALLRSMCVEYPALKNEINFNESEDLNNVYGHAQRNVFYQDEEMNFKAPIGQEFQNVQFGSSHGLQEQQLVNNSDKGKHREFEEYGDDSDYESKLSIGKSNQIINEYKKTELKDHDFIEEIKYTKQDEVKDYKDTQGQNQNFAGFDETNIGEDNSLDKLDMIMAEERDHYYYYSYELEQKMLLMKNLGSIINQFENSLNVIENEFKTMMTLKATYGDEDADIAMYVENNDDGENGLDNNGDKENYMDDGGSMDVNSASFHSKEEYTTHMHEYQDQDENQGQRQLQLQLQLQLQNNTPVLQQEPNSTSASGENIYPRTFSHNVTTSNNFSMFSTPSPTYISSKSNTATP